jgi:DHA2 family multidrug resistance protein-like MFS transporter
MVLLTQVGRQDGLATLVVASVVISLGFAPVFGLTTELIVGSAPPERAGAASGISETGAELGGALGIAILGSVGIAVYRGQLDGSLPAGLPDEAAATARDTLGAATEVASQIPGPIGSGLIDTAQSAFVSGMHTVAAVAAVIAFAVAALAWHALRDHGAPATDSTATDASDDGQDEVDVSRPGDLEPVGC